MTEPKRRHLSDGAIAAMREDIASNRAGGQVHVADDYVERALDEIAWLRWRESELQLTVSGKTFYDPTDVRVVELTGKALAYDLDQAGIELRTADAVELVELRARVVELQGDNGVLRAMIGELAGAADRELVKSETRVAVLKLRLADAMAPRPMSEAPDDGRQMMGVSNIRWRPDEAAWQMGPLHGWLPSGEGGASEQPTPVTDDPDRILSGWCVVSVLCDSCDDSEDGAS